MSSTHAHGNHLALLCHPLPFFPFLFRKMYFPIVSSFSIGSMNEQLSKILMNNLP